MKPDLIITKISAEEADAFREFSSRTFLEAFAHLNTGSDIHIYMSKAFSREQLLSELQNPESEFYFVRSGDQIMGYLKLNSGQTQTDLKESNGIEIERIYVDKNFQGQQIGKLLLDKALDVAKEKNMDYIWLGVWEENKNAIRFYERHGFIATGTHPFLLGNDWQTDIIMRFEIIIPNRKS